MHADSGFEVRSDEAVGLQAENGSEADVGDVLILSWRDVALVPLRERSFPEAAEVPVRRDAQQRPAPVPRQRNAAAVHIVTGAQSARSGYKAYQARSGFETVSAAVSWDHVIDKRWSTHTAVGFTRLLGDAADSPLTKRKTTPMLMTGISYKF